MDNSNIMNEKKNILESVLEKLYLLYNAKTPFSQIEKDILLQSLREAYMSILAMQVDEVENSCATQIDEVENSCATQIDEVENSCAMQVDEVENSCAMQVDEVENSCQLSVVNEENTESEEELLSSEALLVEEGIKEEETLSSPNSDNETTLIEEKLQAPPDRIVYPLIFP